MKKSVYMNSERTHDYPMFDLYGKVADVIRKYDLHPEAVMPSDHETDNTFSVSIECGSSEGYYVHVQDRHECVSLRYHSKDEAVTALGVMLTMLPDN